MPNINALLNTSLEVLINKQEMGDKNGKIKNKTIIHRLNYIENTKEL